jgi:hypothetical protein
MKERPILFSGPMVRALLAGTKMQTRRVVKMKPHQQIEQREDGTDWPWMFNDGSGPEDHWLPCPYGQPGDRLWVREAWAAPHTFDHIPPRMIPAESNFHYLADEGKGGLIGRPSIHMPRCASRILLEIFSVRVERLNDISEADARAEGIKQARFPLDYLWNADYPDRGCGSGGGPVNAYKSLWNEINGTGSWTANPWVWVIEFKRVTP